MQSLSVMFCSLILYNNNESKYDSNGYTGETQTGDFHNNIRKTNDRGAVSMKKVRLEQRKPRIFNIRGFSNTFCLIDMKSSF